MLLEIKNLQVTFHTPSGNLKALQGVNFNVDENECVALVGESGSGKSVTAQAILQLNPLASNTGQILFNNKNLLDQTPQEMENIRGKEIAMVFQNPMNSLNPTMKIGKQISEGLIKHQGMSRQEARKAACEMLELVGFVDASERYGDYPHQFSGGMCQRVMLAIALACRPKLLIADEPTTALDVTVQAQILALMQDLRKKLGMSVILVTHDLGIISGFCDRVAVMYAGRIVEAGLTDEVFTSPKHPYTQMLLQPIDSSIHSKRMIDKPLITVRGLTKHFTTSKRTITAVDSVSFTIAPGETLGLVGESGCGKTTLGRMLINLYKPTKGDVLFEQNPIISLPRHILSRKMQMIFQDPKSSLNPWMTAGAIIGEALVIHNLMPKHHRRQRIIELLEMVGLNEAFFHRYPHELSGGQCQRIGIARALAVEPSFIVCDEPLSALDVSIQAQIINLLKELQKQLGLTYLFISHDLNAVKHMSDRIAVMLQGRIVEISSSNPHISRNKR